MIINYIYAITNKQVILHSPCLKSIPHTAISQDKWIMGRARPPCHNICPTNLCITYHTLIEWKCFLFTYANSWSDGALIAMWVQSMAPITFVNRLIAANCSLMLACSPTVKGNVIYLGDIRMRPFHTAGMARLRDGCEIPDRSASSRWKASVARKPSVVSTCKGITWQVMRGSLLSHVLKPAQAQHRVPTE